MKIKKLSLINFHEYFVKIVGKGSFNFKILLAHYQSNPMRSHDKKRRYSNSFVSDQKKISQLNES